MIDLENFQSGHRGPIPPAPFPILDWIIFSQLLSLKVRVLTVDLSQAK